MISTKKKQSQRRMPDSMTAAEIELAKVTRRAYYRDRYQQNPERQRAANLRYWARRGAAMAKREEVENDARQ